MTKQQTQALVFVAAGLGLFLLFRPKSAAAAPGAGGTSSSGTLPGSSSTCGDMSPEDLLDYQLTGGAPCS